LAETYLPVNVQGDPVQYQVNRNQRGWVLELVHNGGVTKKPDQPVVVDPQNVARVTLRPRAAVRKAVQWRTDGDVPVNVPVDAPLPLQVPPGGTTMIELILSE